MIGVSFDSDKHAWKDAVKKDGLNWVQVVDTTGFEGQLAKYYGIETIPENILLDKKGKIIDFGLSGKELETKLKRLCK